MDLRSNQEEDTLPYQPSECCAFDDLPEELLLEVLDHIDAECKDEPRQKRRIFQSVVAEPQTPSAEPELSVQKH
jgi:hypothetical protein